MYTPTKPAPAGERTHATPTMPVAPVSPPPNFDEDTTGGRQTHVYMQPVRRSADGRDRSGTTAASEAIVSSGACARRRHRADHFHLPRRSLAQTRWSYIPLHDNGFLLGEHRREAKIVAVRGVVKGTPFRSCGSRHSQTGTPGHVRRVGVEHRTSHRPSPTSSASRGTPTGVRWCRSFTHRRARIRSAVLINWCQGIHPPCPGNQPSTVFIEPLLGVPSYFGVVTRRYKFVRYRTGERELYDLVDDPLSS